MKKQTLKRNAKRESLFCLCVTSVFILQWFVFWVCGNINSIRLAFTKFNIASESHDFLPINRIFENFTNFVTDVFSSDGGRYVINGAIMHLVSSFVCLPISYMVAFIIYKKLPMSGFYKVILYLPSILSVMVTVLLFQHFIEGYLDGLWLIWFKKPLPFVFTDPRYDWTIIIIYIVFFGVPGSLLVNLGSMSRVPNELVEYGQLEGASLFKEFCLITVPMVYPVLQVQCLGLFVGFFTTQGPLYTLYGGGAPDNVQTFSYYIFTSIYGGRGGVRPELMYGYVSASNLLIGLVSIPIVQFTKWIFDLFDPGAEF